jgi:DNA polymerase-3 subunit delta'
VSIPVRLPWHSQQWQTIFGALQQQRLHHALLLGGPNGVGKLQFAQRAAALLLCESTVGLEEQQLPCGECRSCVLVAAGNHPDRLTLEPPEDKRIITVDQVRASITQLVLTPHYATRRVIVVSPADALNHHAANTLLKTLEEPVGGVMFILVSARASMLPATIRSRCSGIRFQAPPRAAAVNWLEAEGYTSADDVEQALLWSGGAPLAARDALQSGDIARCQQMEQTLAGVVEGTTNPLQAAASWRALGIREVVNWQLRTTTHVMRSNAAQRGSGAASQPSVAESAAMQAISSKLDLRQLDGICEELLELRNALERQLNPSDQLALEGLAVTWRDAALKSA